MASILEKFPIVDPGKKPIFGLLILWIFGILSSWLKSAETAVIFRSGKSFASSLEFLNKKSLLISIDIYSFGESTILRSFL